MSAGGTVSVSSGSAEAALLLRAGIGDDAAPVNLRARARGRRHRDDRQRLDENGLAAALPLLNVVPEVAGVRGREGHGLGAVHHGAAAQAEDEVASLALCALRARHHGGDEGVGLDDRHVHVRDARGVKRLDDAREDARALDGAAAGGEQEALHAGEPLLAEGAERAAAEDETGGRCEGKGLHGWSPCGLSSVL